MQPRIRFHPAALLAALRGRWRALFHRDALDRELDEEMRFHLDMDIAQRVHAGVSPAEARRLALLAFGNVAQTAEAHRDARGTRLLDDVLADLRYAARGLARTPGYVAVTIFTLATAMAIGTLLFTAVNGFVFRPLPVPGGSGLVAVFTSDYNGPSHPFGASSYPDLADFANAAGPVAELAGEGRVMFGIGLNENIVMAQGAIVSPGYFRMLSVVPILGRFPDDSPPEFPVVVLSYTLWRRTFAADSTLIGRQVNVSGHPFTVVAVASPEFRGTSREIADDFWIDGSSAPLVMRHGDVTHNRGDRFFHVLARLRDGASIEALRARLRVLAPRLSEAYPESWRDATGNARLVTAMLERDAHLATAPRGALLVLVSGIVGLGLGLIAIASANLASMQVARGAARRREVATRLALGAGRGRLVRQLLAEVMLVAIPGTVIGVAAALVVSGLVSHYRPIPLPSIDLSLDWRALGFIAGGLLLVVLVFGLMPALQTVRTDLLTDLKGHGDRPSAGGIRVGGVRGGLIVTQVALSVLFTAASGLVAFALARNAAQGRDEARRVLIGRVNFLPAVGDSTGVGTLADDLIADIAALPGVEGASLAEFVPVRGTRRTVEADVQDANGETKHRVLDANAVGPGYFEVLGLSVLRGRDFTSADARAANPVVVVSRATADALWPSEDPLGKRLTIGARSSTRSVEVIGVVTDPPGQGPATAESYPGLLYLPLRYVSEAELVLHIRAPEGQTTVADQVRQRLRGASGQIVPSEVMSLDRYTDRVDLPQRIMAQAAGGLAALQLLLAAAGLSGLVAYVTMLRRREIGIRAALGATPRSVLALVMRQALRLTLVGGGIGMALSILVSRVVAESLPVTGALVAGALLLAASVLAVTGAIAMLLPACRALGVAPAGALRLD